MTLSRPPLGGATCISGSTPAGGQMTPFDWASLSPHRWRLSFRIRRTCRSILQRRIRARLRQRKVYRRNRGQCCNEDDARVQSE